jgi:molybdopterin molybdotransferase
LQAALERGTRQADAIVTSGGVSAGDADHTRAVLARLGEVGFWKVAMRPGRPFAFGSLQHAGRQAWLFALPGNPVAALVTLLALARDGLMQLAGALPEAVASLRVRSNAAIRKRPGRSEFQRGIVGPGADGRPEVRLTGAQGAGILRSLSLANALIVLPHDRGPVAAGEDVEVWWLDALMA